MPLINTVLAKDLETILEKWSKKAMLDMQQMNLPSGISISAQQSLLADKYAKTFSKASNEMATAITNYIKQGVVTVSTSTGIGAITQ